MAAGIVAYALPVCADQVTLVSIQSGHSILLKAEGLTRVAVGDGRIAGAVPVGTSQVVVNGKAPGHTTLIVWAGGRREAYEITVTAQELDDVAQMLRSAIAAPNVQVVSFDHSIVVRGSVSDGAQFQQISDILGRFDPVLKAQGAVLVNAVTVSQNLGNLQRAIANISGASDIRVDPDGKGNVIVSGNATDAVTAQAILDRARGLAGPYLASNGQLIDRINAMSNSQIDIKVYVLEVDKTAQSNLGISLNSATFNPAIGPSNYSIGSPIFPIVESPSALGTGLGFTIQPFFRTVTLAPTLNLLMQEGHAKVLSSPNLVTSPGQKATFLVGGEIPVVTSTGLGAVNVQYQPYGVQLNVTPEVLGNGSVHATVAPEVSRLDYANAVVVSGFTIPALIVSKLSTDVITRPGESIILGGLVNRLEMKTISKIPLLSSIPILGKLFTSTSYQNQQSDVVFVMTPEIVTR
ncbi:MAG: pilus assembly protein N-terminal domain-containing protein [Candidatus Eremiobacteraeota bacterium]|nr:pilus assembly protein N-terminal domain-containing protein [Candidatus Eremiobacteraeota bacterium]MBV8499289.1 pilus assembly protein N-terminal domain-containing protein [Candidatus Eremiobacteraeota bacterium]